MQQHIHSTYTQHSGICVVTSEHLGLVILQFFSVHHHVFLMDFNIVSCFNKETCTTHSWVANRILLPKRRFHHFHHHTDDMSRSSELSVLTFFCHLAKDVLIDIAHGISVVHVECIHLFYQRLQYTRFVNKENCIPHKASISSFFSVANFLYKRENIVTYHVEHVFCAHFLENLPTK